MKLSDLQSKKIIDIVSGKNVGNIIDVNINNDGRIESFLIEQNKGLFLLNRENDTRIFWTNIEKIGEDVILAKLD